MRIGLSLLAFGVTGFTMMAVNPEAHSESEPGETGYALAISHGPGLVLASTAHDLPAQDRIKAYARTARALACHTVVQIGTVEIGTRCAGGVRALAATVESTSQP